jgi:predicted trehalose synthase
MSAVPGVMLELTAERMAPLAGLVEAWLAGRDHEEAVDPSRPGRRVTVHEVEVLRAGRPALFDVLAEVDGRAVHAVLGVRADGEVEAAAEEGSGLGLIHDDQGIAVVIDALRDPELAPLVLAAVTGEPAGTEPVSIVADGDDATVLDFGGRRSLTVFPWLVDGPHLGVEMLVALDEAGFNHLAAPLAVWRRGGRDLGVVQEVLPGSAGGWALALTSLRDLHGFGGRPEEAGGDFGPEAQALGTMTARMHLALHRSFGGETGAVSDWAERVEAEARDADPTLLQGADVEAALAATRSSGLRSPMLRTHGDFHLGRTARTDAGWVVADWTPGGRPPAASGPVFRSPLADVADMCWSLHHVAAVSTAERDPTGRAGPGPLARAWATRNRRAFLAAYLATLGIGDLVGSDRALVRQLVTVLEVGRSAAAGPGARAAAVSS